MYIYLGAGKKHPGGGFTRALLSMTKRSACMWTKLQRKGYVCFTNKIKCPHTHRQGLTDTVCVPVQPHRPGSQRVFTALCRLIGFPVQIQPVCCSPSLVSYPPRSFRPSQGAIPICGAYSCTTPGHKEPEACH